MPALLWTSGSRDSPRQCRDYGSKSIRARTSPEEGTLTTAAIQYAAQVMARAAHTIAHDNGTPRVAYLSKRCS